MTELTVHGVTVSVDFGDKTYGTGNGRFNSVSTKVPDGSPGIPLSRSDEIVSEGIQMYFTAWQTMMQTRYATGEITGNDYKKQTVEFMVRIEKIQRLYKLIKGTSTEELEAFLKKDEKANVDRREYSE